MFEEDGVETAEEFTKSECSCYLCTTINNIDKKWGKFEPKTEIEEILKNNVDKLEKKKN